MVTDVSPHCLVESPQYQVKDIEKPIEALPEKTVLGKNTLLVGLRLAVAHLILSIYVP